jgi:methyl-accepting chemotaxis protein
MKRMTIGRQVAAGFAACLGALLLSALIGTLAVQDVDRSKSRIIEDRAPVISQAHELAAISAAKGAIARGYLIGGREEMLLDLDRADEEFHVVLDGLNTGGQAGTAPLRDRVASSDEAWDGAFRELANERRRAGSVEDIAGSVERTLFPAYNDVQAALADLVANMEAAVVSDIAASEERAERAVLVLWLLVGLALLAMTALAVWMTRRISRQLGDLALNVDAAANNILAVVSQQVAGASEQSAAVQQTVATVDELVQTAEQAVQRAQTVADRAQESVQVAEVGDQAVSDSNAGMLEIRNQVLTISETVAELTSRAQLIREVVRTVDAIAGETHLLALNAAVEAARAGEHGRGFSVVAGEVKNLADQSKFATSKVNGILAEIEKGTDTAVLATQEGTKSSEAGTELIARAGQTIRELAETIASAALAAEQIAASSRQQAAATVQISDAMRNVNTVMEQNVAAARQSEETARDLTDAARRMKLLVGAV